MNASLGSSFSSSAGFCCSSHSFFLRILANEKEETCFPSFGAMDIFGGTGGGVGTERAGFAFSFLGVSLA
ncbi:MAG: hypothetical protein ACPG8F_00485 [Flavobacteriaceae bacterium]